MYYGTVVHTIVRTTTGNASMYYSHDVLRSDTTKYALSLSKVPQKCRSMLQKEFMKVKISAPVFACD